VGSFPPPFLKEEVFKVPSFLMRAAFKFPSFLKGATIKVPSFLKWEAFKVPPFTKGGQGGFAVNPRQRKILNGYQIILTD
jgi:hypothetical protein